MSSQTIFVTGANGFVGQHIVKQLLDAGYKVRGSVRGSKVELVKKWFAEYGDRFEAIDIPDVAHGDHSAALKGVYALLHVAAPLPYREGQSGKALIDNAVDGAVNILNSAAKANVKRVVFTSSMVAIFGSEKGTFTNDDWNPITRDFAEASDSTFLHYIAGKVFAEKAVHKFAEEHKDIDVTVLNPPWMFGPFIPTAFLPTKELSALSTDVHIYHLISGESEFPSSAGYLDVRDAAKLHVKAITSPPATEVGVKRIALVSPHGFQFSEALESIARLRPELKSRLVDVSTAPVFPHTVVPIENERVKQVLGFDLQDSIKWEDTIIDTIDSLIALEKKW